MQPDQLIVEPDGEADTGVCDCCGQRSRKVWGYIHTNEATLAAYFVHWTMGRVDHGAWFDLIVGAWGRGASAADRCAVRVEFRLGQNGPQFMVRDAAPVAASLASVATQTLTREQVVGTPLAAEVFALLDAIWLQDGRIQELSSAPESSD